jgi:hypothetical protein
MSSYRDQTTWKRELREMREAEARELRAREASERAERERPIREAEEALKATAVELGKLTREKILTQVDDDRYKDPDMESARMSQADADAFNRTELKAFLVDNPHAYWSEANRDALGSYFERNHLRIVSRKYLEAAWERLSSYGLLEPEPIPEATHRPAAQPEAPAPEPDVYEGWDPDTGERKKYSKWEVDRMTGEEYRRVFRLYKDSLRLPSRPAF